MRSTRPASARRIAAASSAASASVAWGSSLRAWTSARKRRSSGAQRASPGPKPVCQAASLARRAPAKAAGIWSRCARSSSTDSISPDRSVKADPRSLGPAALNLATAVRYCSSASAADTSDGMAASV
jgi:hypothetical protein